MVIEEIFAFGLILTLTFPFMVYITTHTKIAKKIKRIKITPETFLLVTLLLSIYVTILFSFVINDIIYVLSRIQANEDIKMIKTVNITFIANLLYFLFSLIFTFTAALVITTLTANHPKFKK